MPDSHAARQFLVALGLVWLIVEKGSLFAFDDATPTKVVSVSPRDGASDIKIQISIQVHFSKGLKLGSLTADSVRLLDPSGRPVSVQLGSDIEADVVNLQP